MLGGLKPPNFRHLNPLNPNAFQPQRPNTPLSLLGIWQLPVMHVNKAAALIKSGFVGFQA